MGFLRLLRVRVLVVLFVLIEGLVFISLLHVWQNVDDHQLTTNVGTSYTSSGHKQNFSRTTNFGSRENYSTPDVNNFVRIFQLKHNSINSMYQLKSEEGYDSFLKRLSLKRKKGMMLVKATNTTVNNSAERFHRGINQYYLYDPNDEQLIQDLLRDLYTLPIISAELPYIGSQLKLEFILADGTHARFKPMRKTHAGEGTRENTFFFDDFERYKAEIAGFHLDRVMGFNRAVPTVGRVINMTRDLETFFLNKDFVEYVYTSPAGNLCFVAKCYQYCGANYPFCGCPNVLEGSMSAFLPPESMYKRYVMKHPYEPKYTVFETADWKNDDNYCENHVKLKLSSHYLLEIIDLAVFDFLAGNLDRHAYQIFDDFKADHFVPVFDTGRGFGKPHHDYMICLTPLRQCCRIRLSTLAKIIKLYQGPDSLSHMMRTSLNSDPLSPVLSESHLDALDRRIGKVIKTVSDCINNGRSWDTVVVQEEDVY